MLTESTRLLPTADALSEVKTHALKRGDSPVLFIPINVGPAALLALPFDLLRIQYASAVMAGLTRRSLLASAKWERSLDALEKLILGPLARRR